MHNVSPSNFTTSHSATRETDFVSVAMMLLQAYGCEPVSLAVCSCCKEQQLSAGGLAKVDGVSEECLR